MSRYFGTDGIRGLVGTPPITADFFLKIGWAVGKILCKYPNPTIVIGKDTRISGYMLESALEAGFTASGTNVILVGPMPTPAVAYLTKTYNATAGAVISASHNPYYDNGIKFFSNFGDKLSNSDQSEIEKMLANQIQSVASKYIGKAKRAEQAEGRYIEFCKSTFDRELSLNGLKIVIDCANGATYHIAPFVFSELGAEVININNKPDGFNINHNCGATNTNALAKKVLANKANLGLAFDGDGDRLIMIDHQGNTVSGDEILYIIAKDRKIKNSLKNNGVVGTKMTNLGIVQALKNLNINFYSASVGDRFVKQLMQKNNLALGGENSGHIICLNHMQTGDAIIAALNVLTIIVSQQKSLVELTKDLNKTHQHLENINIKKPIDLSNNKLQKVINQIEKKLGKSGRVLIRPSGTEPLIRIMVEGTNKDFVTTSATQLARTISHN